MSATTWLADAPHGVAQEHPGLEIAEAVTVRSDLTTGPPLPVSPFMPLLMSTLMT